MKVNSRKVYAWDNAWWIQVITPDETYAVIYQHNGWWGRGTVWEPNLDSYANVKQIPLPVQHAMKDEVSKNIL